MPANLRIATGFDLHHLKRGVPLVLGTVNIPSEFGLVSNTDGDVVTHALLDALLATAGVPDIGVCFPSTDKRWYGKPSSELIRAVRADHLPVGHKLLHADITILAEQPTLAPHYESIRNALATALGVSPDRITIKARSLEGVGFIGSGKAIAALVTVLAELPPSNAKSGENSPLFEDKSPYSLSIDGPAPEGTYLAFADGGSRGNPGPAACACVIFAPDGAEIARATRYLGESTNNQAEYAAALLALEELERLHLQGKPVVLHLDASLVFHQAIGKYRTKHATLRKMLRELLRSLSRFSDLRFKLIPRADNAIADRLVNQTLDQNTL